MEPTIRPTVFYLDRPTGAMLRPISRALRCGIWTRWRSACAIVGDDEAAAHRGSPDALGGSLMRLITASRGHARKVRIVRCRGDDALIAEFPCAFWRRTRAGFHPGLPRLCDADDAMSPTCWRCSPSRGPSISYPEMAARPRPYRRRNGAAPSQVNPPHSANHRIVGLHPRPPSSRFAPSRKWQPSWRDPMTISLISGLFRKTLRTARAADLLRP